MDARLLFLLCGAAAACHEVRARPPAPVAVEGLYFAAPPSEPAPARAGATRSAPTGEVRAPAGAPSAGATRSGATGAATARADVAAASGGASRLGDGVACEVLPATGGYRVFVGGARPVVMRARGEVDDHGALRLVPTPPGSGAPSLTVLGGERGASSLVVVRPSGGVERLVRSLDVRLARARSRLGERMSFRRFSRDLALALAAHRRFVAAMLRDEAGCRALLPAAERGELAERLPRHPDELPPDCRQVAAAQVVETLRALAVDVRGEWPDAGRFGALAEELDAAAQAGRAARAFTPERDRLVASGLVARLASPERLTVRGGLEVDVRSGQHVECGVLVPWGAPTPAAELGGPSLPVALALHATGAAACAESLLDPERPTELGPPDRRGRLLLDPAGEPRALELAAPDGIALYVADGLPLDAALERLALDAARAR